MAIIQTTEEINGIPLRHTISDNGLMLRQLPTEILYSETYDVLNAPYTYEETDIPVKVNE